MILSIRKILWRILGIDYNHTLKIHDYIFLNSDKHSKIGNKTYHNGALVWRWTNARLNIGNYCSIANGVKFIVDEGYHKSSKITSFPLINNLYKNDNSKLKQLKQDILDKITQREGINIGNDVWIGMGATIMPGVIVGNGVTIGANSVVTKDIPNYAIVGGSPAKVISYKYDEKTISKLNKIAWWNWSDEKVKQRIEDFYKETNFFIEKYEV